MRYAHTNIIARDWKELVDFYCKVFECELVPPVRNQSGDWLSQGTGVPNAHLKGAHLRLPGHGNQGPTLEIYQYKQVITQEPIAPNQRGFGHLAFEVDDVEQILSKVKAHGGSANGKITIRKVEGVGQITFVYARDPEGNLLELQNWS
ncbi:MAG: hypothetical protein Sapg2KO_51400 [Saprospiraceae bacterium]